MNVSGGSFAAVNRDHISRYNQACAQSAQQASSTQSAQQTGTTQGGFLRNIASVETQAIRRSFIDNPHQTDLSLNYVKNMATDALPDSLKEAKLSFLSEPLKMVLGMIADDVNASAKDKRVFNSICQTLVNAKGNSKKEMAVQEPLKLLLGKYAQASLNKFIATFTEDCREAWKQHHTGYETTPVDEMIFKVDILACHTMLAKYIDELSSPDIKWVEMGQQARYFQSTCASLSKTLLNYDPNAHEAPPANGPDNPAGPSKDVPDAPAGPQATPEVQATPIDNGMQYTFPGGPGQSPVVINIHGPSATANAYGAPGENGMPGENGVHGGNGEASKAADNKYTLGIELLKNMPKTQEDRDFFREYMQGFLPQLSSVTRGDGTEASTATSATQADTFGGAAGGIQATTQGTLADNIESIALVSQGLQAGTGEGISTAGQDVQTDISGEQGVQVSTGLLDELLTPPQMSGNERASQFGDGEQTGLQGNSSENMYAASREVANALSDLASELGSPPATPGEDYSDVFFPDQNQSQETGNRVPLQMMDSAGFEVEGFSQESVGTDAAASEPGMKQMSASSGTVTMASSTGTQSAEDSSTVGTQAGGLQSGGVNGVQDQAQVRENVIREKIVSATAASQAPGRVYSSRAITDRENRVGNQEQRSAQENGAGEGATESSTLTQTTARTGSVTDASTQWETAATGLDQAALAGKVVRERIPSDTASSQAVDRANSLRASGDLTKPAGVQEQPAVQSQIRGGGNNTSSITTPTAGKGAVADAVAQWESYAISQNQVAFAGKVVRENITSSTVTSQPTTGNANPMRASGAQGMRVNGQQQPAQEPEADIATPADAKSGVKGAIAAFEKNANAQRAANERLVGQHGSGMSSSKVRDNATGANVNYRKDLFQPAKGLTGNNASSSSHQVYTTNRTIDPFSRRNAPGTNFVKQFNKFDVRPNDLARLNSISSDRGSEE